MNDMAVGASSRQMVGGMPQPTGYDGVPLDASPPATIEAKSVDYKKDFEEKPDHPKLKELFASTPELSKIMGGAVMGKNPDGTENIDEIKDYIGAYNRVVSVSDAFNKGKDKEKINEGAKILKDSEMFEKEGQTKIDPMTPEQVADPKFQEKFKKMMDSDKLKGLKEIGAIGNPSTKVEGKKENDYSANQVNLVLKALQGTVRTEAPPPPPPMPQPQVAAEQRPEMPFAGGPQYPSGGVLHQLPPPTIEITV